MKKAREYKRYKYRKITPEKLNLMRNLRESGFSFGKIGELMDIADSSVQYWLSPREHKRKQKAAREYNSKISKKKLKEKAKNHYEYNKKYLMERYHNDEEFHERYKKMISKSQRKIYHQRKDAGLCVECGKKLIDSRIECKKCREKTSMWDKIKRLKRQKLGLCQCGEKLADKKFKNCEKCRKIQSDFKRKRIKEGKCVKCGKKLELKDTNFKNCEDCRKKLTLYFKKYCQKNNAQKILYSSCSEEVFRLDLGRTWFDDKEKEKFMESMLDMFKPWSDDKKECNEFALLDEYNNCMLIRDRCDGSNDEELEELYKGCKKHKIKIKKIGDKEDAPLFSIGDNFFYSLKGNVKVVDLDYSNVKKANEVHKKLLKIWRLK